MTENIDNDTIATFVSNLLGQEDRHCRLKWNHGSLCPGIEIHGYRITPEEYDYEECDTLACDSLKADIWVQVGGSSSGGLCADHLLTWLEHEVDINCEGCVTMFSGIEGPE